MTDNYYNVSEAKGMEFEQEGGIYCPGCLTPFILQIRPPEGLAYEHICNECEAPLFPISSLFYVGDGEPQEEEAKEAMISGWLRDRLAEPSDFVNDFGWEYEPKTLGDL